jgi:putative transposase
MPDHVHAILSGDDSFGISAFVQVWKKTSSYRIRRFFEQELQHYLQMGPAGSPIWQARFYDFNIDSDQKLNEKLDYMHENPVAARLVATSLEWKWSSVRFYEEGEPTGVVIDQGE